MKKGLTNRQKQAINTRNTIYTTAILLMEKHGFDNITIEDICTNAGVSVGSFYHYFKSKNDIFFEIYKKADEYFMEVKSEILSDSNVLNRIFIYFQYYGKVNITSGLETVKQLYNSNNKNFITEGRYMQVLLREILEEAAANDYLNDSYTIDEILDHMFISTRGLVYDWCLREGGYDLEKRMFAFSKMIFSIFLSEKHKNH